MFAAAIILFILVSGHPPFTTAEPKDPFYRCLAAGKVDIFWQQHSKGKENGEAFFSPEFKDLITNMLALDPPQRPKLEELIKHPWLLGATPTPEEVFMEFKQRKDLIKQSVK